MVVFQALNWDARDDDTSDAYVISIMGRTEDGKSVCVSTQFQPYFFVKLNPKEPSNDAKKIYREMTPFGIDSFGIVMCKDVWGFQNNTKFPFVKLTFNTHADMKAGERKLKKKLDGEYRLRKVFEANIEPMLRFMHRTGIQSTGWVDTGDCEPQEMSRCDIDLYCDDWKKLKPVARDDIAPFVICSFDIETNSSTGKFPDPLVEDDACFQIGMTLKKQGSDEIYDKTCLCYKQTADDPKGEFNVVSYETEKELLMGFKDYLVKHDVDVMTGWNIFGFDLKYIHDRAIVCGCPSSFFELGKLLNVTSELVIKQLSSSALGDNTLKLFPMPGRYIFDLFHEVKREQKLDSYTLNNVSAVFLNDKKIDMPPREMFRRFAEGDPDKLMEVAEYCVKDTILPHRLMDKLCIFLNILEMAKATWVPVNYLSERGQQIKVFSQLTRKARELGYMIPTIYYGKIQSDGYEGATVLDAQKGAYYTPITALDFASLYPSIMMAHNLCYSTLVMDPKYDDVPGVTYETFQVGDKTYKFAQDVPSLLPKVLEELKAFRKQAKKDMANATGSMKQVYNGKQLAYKISMNSVYGFTGVGKGMLPCVPIASTVTCKGRMMIEDTKNYVEANFPGAKVRYGDTDSVMIEFDCQGRTGKEAIEYSWALGEKAAAACNHLFKKPNDLELEKVYCPYFLYSKKRYAAKMWVKKGDEMVMDCIDIKGLQVVRRDNTPFVRTACKEILDVILESNNPEGAKECARRHASNLLGGDVPNEDLVLSQKLADSYKSNNLPHVAVRDKMRERDPGSEPQSGDRVPFVIVETDNPKHKQYEKAEDPKYAKDNNVRLDYRYYFTNKFINPVCDLLEPLVDNPLLDIFSAFIEKKPVKMTTVVVDEIKSQDDLQNCTAAGLSAYCKGNALKASGAKSDLVSRVWAHMQGEMAPPPVPVQTITCPEDLEKCTIAVLKAYCKVNTLKVSGTKSVLYERVLNHVKK